MEEATKNKLLAGSVIGALAWGALGPERRRKAGELLLSFLNAVAVAKERKRLEQAAIQSQASQQATTPSAVTQLAELISSGQLPSAPAPSQSLAAPDVGPDARWREVIVHPSVVLVVGKRGSGKSALAYRLLELFRYRLTPYVVGAPSQARRLLPEWIGIVPDLDNLPHDSIAVVDEAYMSFHSRRSMAEESRAMSQNVNLSRQRNQTLIFVSQEARQVDRNIASAANVVVFKELGMLQQDFDRPELRRLVGQASEALETVQGERRRWAYVYSPDADFLGLVENQLPTFWKPALSRLFASGDTPGSVRRVRKLSPRERAARAKELRVKGCSYSQIAQELGVSKPAVLNYLKGYPYRN